MTIDNVFLVDLGYCSSSLTSYLMVFLFQSFCYVLQDINCVFSDTKSADDIVKCALDLSSSVVSSVLCICKVAAHSSRHVDTMGKSSTRSCLYNMMWHPA